MSYAKYLHTYYVNHWLLSCMDLRYFHVHHTLTCVYHQCKHLTRQLDILWKTFTRALCLTHEISLSLSATAAQGIPASRVKCHADFYFLCQRWQTWEQRQQTYFHCKLHIRFYTVRYSHFPLETLCVCFQVRCHERCFTTCSLWNCKKHRRRSRIKEFSSQLTFRFIFISIALFIILHCGKAAWNDLKIKSHYSSRFMFNLVKNCLLTDVRSVWQTSELIAYQWSWMMIDRVSRSMKPPVIWLEK